jgi:hypothetical protein
VELPDHTLVFRLVTEDERYIPLGAPYPNGTVFEPSSEDKQEAQARDQPVRISVWDAALTRVPQALAFRGNPRPCRAWGVLAAVIMELRAKRERPALRAVRDPLLDDARPGAEGHCGIEGLDRQPGESKLRLKELRDDLATRCRELS